METENIFENMYDELFKIVVQPIKVRPMIALFLAFAATSGFGVFVLTALWAKTVAFCYMVMNLLLSLIYLMEG